MKSMQNILFFGIIGFYKRDYERFELKKLSKYYNVNFIDLTNLCRDQFYKLEKKKFFKSKVLIKVNSLEEFKKILIKKKFICAFDLSDNVDLDQFRKAINENNTKLIQIQTSLVPIFKRSFFLKIKYLLRIIFFNKNLIHYYLKKNLNRWQFSRTKKNNFFYDYILSGGMKGEIFKKGIVPKTKYIYTNSLDYEIFKREKKTKNIYIAKNNYFLFLDQYLPFHNGFTISGVPPFVTEKKYYKSLNNFFNYLEKKFKVEIIIVSHPRSNIKINKEKFNNRKIFNYKFTNKLISKCKAVINYSSTAMGFAVMHKKPIFFYTSNEINNSQDAYHVNYLADLLGASISNIDDTSSYESNFKKLFFVNRKKYSNYFYNYIKHLKSDKNLNFIKMLKIIKENSL